MSYGNFQRGAAEPIGEVSSGLEFLKDGWYICIVTEGTWKSFAGMPASSHKLVPCPTTHPELGDRWLYHAFQINAPDEKSRQINWGKFEKFLQCLEFEGTPNDPSDLNDRRVAVKVGFAPATPRYDKDTNRALDFDNANARAGSVMTGRSTFKIEAKSPTSPAAPPAPAGAPTQSPAPTPAPAPPAAAPQAPPPAAGPVPGAAPQSSSSPPW